MPSPGHHVAIVGYDGADFTHAHVDSSGRLRVSNYIYDPVTLAWVAMKQPESETAGYSQIIAYDASQNPVYIGKAPAGADDTAGKALAIWQICKITYDVNNNPTDIAWADGDLEFDNVWDNRASYTYH